MEIIGIDPKLFDYLEGKPRHQSIESAPVEIIDSLGKALFGERRKIKIRIFHDRMHVVGAEVVPHAPHAVFADEHHTEHHGHAFGSRDFGSPIFGDGMVYEVQNTSATENPHDDGQTDQLLRSLKIETNVFGHKTRDNSDLRPKSNIILSTIAKKS